MTERASGFRRYLARGVVVVYLFLVISIILTVVSADRSALGHTRGWIAWIIAFVPLTLGFAAALRTLSAADRGRSRRLSVLATSMLVVGMVIIAADTAMGR